MTLTSSTPLCKADGVWWVRGVCKSGSGREADSLAGTARAPKRCADPLLHAAAAAALLLQGAIAGAAEAPILSSIFDPASPPAAEIYRLSMLVLGICAAIFVTVAGLVVYCVVRFRRRAGDDDREPPQIYGSNPIELAWTMVPFLIVFVLFLVTTRSLLAVQKAAPPASAVNVTVIGHQWWWEFRYPDLGIVTANELHIPVSSAGDRRPTYLRLESVDVAHSFWVPRLNGKTDLIPNRINTMWIEPMEAGVYFGQCAEYCGTQHAHMLLRVVAHPPAEFDSWVAAQRAPAATDPAAARGRALFESAACINCHRVGGTVADGVFGPDLTHLMSRETIGAGAAANTVANLNAWIANPDQLKPGALMPAMKLSDADVAQIATYLATLH
jgi:cytochrome c oxidase subunit 2